MKDAIVSADAFEALELPRKEVSLSGMTYHVYSNASEFVSVEAENAQAAIAASGVTKPLKVVRFDVFNRNVVNLEAITAPKPAADEPAETAAAEAAPTEAGGEAA